MSEMRDDDELADDEIERKQERETRSMTDEAICKSGANQNRMSDVVKGRNRLHKGRSVWSNFRRLL